MKKAIIAMIFLIVAAGIIFVAKKTLIDPLFVPRAPVAVTTKKEIQKQSEPDVVSNTSIQVTALVTAPAGSVYVRIADNDEERRLGLSYFKSLPINQGMFFKFDTARTYAFWMKDMNFPIDIVWLKSIGNGYYQVVYTVENATPGSYPQRFTPDTPADAVLEVNAFQSRYLGITKNGPPLHLN